MEGELTEEVVSAAERLRKFNEFGIKRLTDEMKAYIEVDSVNFTPPRSQLMLDRQLLADAFLRLISKAEVV